MGAIAHSSPSGMAWFHHGVYCLWECMSNHYRALRRKQVTVTYEVTVT